MQLRGLDHVNVRTAKLDEMIAWYDNVLDMKTGPRPAFQFPGAWLYCSGNPIVHLIGVDEEPKVTELKIEHFAIGASGLSEFLDRLKANKVDYRPSKVLDFGILQINIWDPDNNHIHVDFAIAEADGVDL